jgi:hypothetical protein
VKCPIIHPYKQTKGKKMKKNKSKKTLGALLRKRLGLKPTLGELFRARMGTPKPKLGELLRARLSA